MINTIKEEPREYADMKNQTGFVVTYVPREDGSVSVQAISDNAPVIEAVFARKRIDEAHILYMEATELLRSRAGIHEEHAAIRKALEGLIALFRGEHVSFSEAAVGAPPRRPSDEFIANPGKQISIDVDGVVYERLPVRTRLITTKDTDLLPIIEDYVKPYLRAGDMLFVSEKALTITQGRVVDMGTIKPSPLARFLARNVRTYYGSGSFHGFGHGTALAMQLFLEEAGYLRVICAGIVSAITRPFGVKGMFYRICGKRAKSIDCPMSFLILEYAHSAKLAPNDPSGEARRFKRSIGSDVVILDANYRGAFSLGKSTRAISESFIEKLFQDNPLGQSDEMTPFAIVRKA
jgi:hypothetical protein